MPGFFFKLIFFISKDIQKSQGTKATNNSKALSTTPINNSKPDSDSASVLVL